MRLSNIRNIGRFTNGEKTVNIKRGTKVGYGVDITFYLFKNKRKIIDDRDFYANWGKVQPIENMRKEFVAVVCKASDGAPFVNVCEVELTDYDYSLGYHYDTAIEMTEDQGYEGPFTCFDNSEHSALITAGQTLSKHVNGPSQQ